MSDKQENKKVTTTLPYAIIYGIINAILGIPVLYGYTIIIFPSLVFQQVMPSLCKLVLFSSVVHQICFSLLSSLPFAIGQVQDAGLLFLSRMTTNIAIMLSNESADVIISTSLVVCALSTFLLGICLVIMGKLQLARYVSYLPMPVIGGYLAFIGFFCLEAGLSLATGKVINGIGTWSQLWDEHLMILCIPALISGAGLSYIARKITHVAALPIAMIILPAIFFLLLLITDTSLQESRDFGWVGKADHPASFISVFSLFKFDLVRWDVIPSQIPIWIGMVIVVSFSSSLDVTAIELDMGTPLDTNHELRTVGWSNVISGLFGGFTGSYIFSQTIFTYRTCHHRGVGWVVTLLEILCFIIRIDLLAYQPLFFFAATLIFISYELMVEWLIEVRDKLLKQEYIVLLLTFLAIQIFGLNEGLIIGCLCSFISFGFDYAMRDSQTKFVKRIGMQPRSTYMRQFLHDQNDLIVTLQLEGNIFFASAVTVKKQIIKVIDDNLIINNDNNNNFIINNNNNNNKKKKTVVIKKKNKKKYELINNNEFDKEDDELIQAIEKGNQDLKLNNNYSINNIKNNKKNEDENDYLLKKINTISYSSSDDSIVSPPFQELSDDSIILNQIKSFIILDMSEVKGIDASAARTCFLPVAIYCSQRDIKLIFANANPRIEYLLSAHSILTDDLALSFPTIWEALDFTENYILNNFAPKLNDDDIINNNNNNNINIGNDNNTKFSFLCTCIKKILELDNNEQLDELFLKLDEYINIQEYKQNETIYDMDDYSFGIYFIQEGKVHISRFEYQAPNIAIQKRKKDIRRMKRSGSLDTDTPLDSPMAHLSALSSQRVPRPETPPFRARMILYEGGFFGFTDFQLNQPRRAMTVAMKDTTLYILTRKSLKKMEKNDEKLWIIFQRLQLKLAVTELTNLL